MEINGKKWIRFKCFIKHLYFFFTLLDEFYISLFSSQTFRLLLCCNYDVSSTYKNLKIYT